MGLNESNGIKEKLRSRLIGMLKWGKGEGRLSIEFKWLKSLQMNVSIISY